LRGDLIAPGLVCGLAHYVDTRGAVSRRNALRLFES